MKKIQTSQNVRKSQYVSVIWCLRLKLLRFVTSTLCAAMFSNSNVKWRLRYLMLRFVAVPAEGIILWWGVYSNSVVWERS